MYDEASEYFNGWMTSSSIPDASRSACLAACVLFEDSIRSVELFKSSSDVFIRESEVAMLLCFFYATAATVVIVELLVICCIFC